MKYCILVLAIKCSAVSLMAQPKDLIVKWLYDLPVSKAPVKIKNSILTDSRFQENSKTGSQNLKHAASTYWGVIQNPVLPKIGRVDSAKVSLTAGTLNTMDGYSGAMKWLRFEYFSSDTVYLNDLYESACMDFKNDAPQQKPAGFRKKDEVAGEGIKYIYIDNTSELRSVSVLRVRYTNGKQGFSIHFSGSSD